MQAVQEVYNEVAELGLTLKTPLAHGILEAPAQNQQVYRMEVTMWFPQVPQCCWCSQGASNCIGSSAHWHVSMHAVRVELGCMAACMHLWCRPLILPDDAHKLI